jgi:hypothetical protein
MTVECPKCQSENPYESKIQNNLCIPLERLEGIWNIANREIYIIFSLCMFLVYLSKIPG